MCEGTMDQVAYVGGMCCVGCVGCADVVGCVDGVGCVVSVEDGAACPTTPAALGAEHVTARGVYL